MACMNIFSSSAGYPWLRIGPAASVPDLSVLSAQSGCTAVSVLLASGLEATHVTQPMSLQGRKCSTHNGKLSYICHSTETSAVLITVS